MNADGSGQTNITNTSSVSEGGPDWQPIPKSHVRPKGAQPLWISFVPAYASCVSPNRRHGGGLAYDSCASPQTKSSRLTLGSPDANGKPAKSGGQVYVKLAFDNPSTTTTDETDVLVDAEITDVRRKSDLEDYIGELSLLHSTRITDRDNTPYPGGPGPGTAVDFGFAWTIACASTSDTTLGSRCAVSTSANSVVPGAVTKGKKAIWQIGDLQVYDGGSDGLSSTTGDNTLFEVQGVFVP
jgi:hypothetical protein